MEVLKSVSYDRNVVQFYGTCPFGNQTMLVLEYMEVQKALLLSNTLVQLPVVGMTIKACSGLMLAGCHALMLLWQDKSVLHWHGFTDR